MRLVALVAGAIAAVALPFAALADSWTDIRYAVSNNQEAEVVRLLDSGVDINIQNDEGWTPLHIAAEQGHVRMVNYLLARGADPNIKTTRGRTAFDVGSGYSQVQAALKAKMAAPTDPFAGVLGPKGPAPAGGGAQAAAGELNDGRTASTRPRLQARDAVWYNNKDQLAAILDAGLDVNTLDQTGRETLLHAAAGRDRIDIAKMLIARGASKTIRDKDGKLAVDYATSPEMRALLGGAGKPAPNPGPVADNSHCKVMWREATALCGLGATSCNTSAHIRYQSCLKKGTWY